MKPPPADHLVTTATTVPASIPTTIVATAPIPAIISTPITSTSITSTAIPSPIVIVDRIHEQRTSNQAPAKPQRRTARRPESSSRASRLLLLLWISSAVISALRWRRPVTRTAAVALRWITSTVAWLAISGVVAWLRRIAALLGVAVLRVSGCAVGVAGLLAKELADETSGARSLRVSGLRAELGVAVLLPVTWLGLLCILLGRWLAVLICLTAVVGASRLISTASFATGVLLGLQACC